VNVTLPAHLETWLAEQVNAGVFSSAEEAVQQAFELLRMHVALEEQNAQLSSDATRRSALRALVGRDHSAKRLLEFAGTFSAGQAAELLRVTDQEFGRVKPESQ
jgi:Arc/MetJ-type ribon-helix-helix transcriptional regulator